MTSSSDSPGSSSQQPLQCPRCESMDTKFCYYNNYSTAQPRHFCKNCKRYWTAGGSLRNVPVGGGMRKNKKARLSKQVHELMSSPSSSSQQQQQQQQNFGDGYCNPNPNSNGFLDESSSLGPTMFSASPSSSTDNRHGDEAGFIHGSDSMASYYNSSAFRYFESPAESHSYGSPFMNPAQFNWRASPYSGFYGHGPGHGFQPDGFNSPQQQHQDAAAYAAFMHYQFPFKPYDQTQAQNLTQNQAQAQAQTQTRTQAQTQKAQAQAQTNSGEISEVVSEPSQASSDAVKDPHLPMHQNLNQYTMLNKHQPKTTEENAASAWHQNSQNSHSQVHDNSPSSNNEVAMPVPDGQYNKDRSSTEEDEDELGNVVNVNPNDWEQVSEVLFGGTSDFFSLTGF